ncbi:neurotrypsin [Plakobranchus ocellatus]|uniref:Neurotrypsin n=1 Tax=Plakobranchus ocellatus TaxID=259542 RepID=A0AAV4BV41_9GAST|nr:neurotrypsin [Plakobranchus ocellatus]
MCIIKSTLLLSILAIVFHSTAGSIWTIHLRSHPYKTELYTAEFIKGNHRYFWCADHIHLQDAVVLCNQVSAHNGLGPYTPTTPRIEFGALHYDPAVKEAFTNETFACVGNESRLRDCPTVPVPEDERCPSENLGQVDCYPAGNAKKNLTASLISPENRPEMGVVRVESSSLHYLAGFICNQRNQWTSNEARVVCRSLGYSGLWAWPVDPAIVSDSQPADRRYIMRNVQCQGSEETINDCPHTDMCMAVDFLSKSFSCATQCDGEPAAVLCS